MTDFAAEMAAMDRQDARDEQGNADAKERGCTHCNSAPGGCPECFDTDEENHG